MRILWQPGAWKQAQYSPMKILFWNIRGAQKKGVLATLWYMVGNHKFDMVILQETHLLQEEAIAFLSKFKRQWEGVFVSNEGRYGGLIIFWRKNNFEVRCIYKNDQCINCLAKQGNGFPFLISGIYASTNYK
ncbi:hypothetical protein Cni_G07249 [Canna indica]|uniref:Endonuclease/exonuclease/phosphatase domain-containing protein n=1 Tax=Canna indica TaxID=4628 RepID=A0AAQ3K0S1_9LILI|nr:hypothetical protein Cni_G07249 [Canna indica]